MKMLKNAVAAVAAALLFGTSLMPAMANDGAKTLSKSVAAFQAISAVPKKGIPPALLKNVQGVAIFPGFTKLDSMVSGRAASGLLLVRDASGTWSSPVFVSLSGGTLGWQIVGDPMDVILLFKDRRTVEAILKEKLILGGKNAPVAGPVGASLKGATEAELKAGINSYVFTHGACADVTVATAAVQVAAAANDAFYGGNKVRTELIVSGKVDKSSAEVGNLQKLLAEFAARK